MKKIGAKRRKKKQREKKKKRRQSLKLTRDGGRREGEDMREEERS